MSRTLWSRLLGRREAPRTSTPTTGSAPLGRLGRLPPELRDRIYFYYVYEPGGYKHDGETNKLRIVDGSPIDLRLMYTCSTVANELRGMALGANTITFGCFVPDKGTPKAGRRAERFEYCFLARLLLSQQMVINRLTHTLEVEDFADLRRKYPSSQLADAAYALCRKIKAGERDLDRIPDGPLYRARMCFANRVDTSPTYALDALRLARAKDPAHYEASLLDGWKQLRDFFRQMKDQELFRGWLIEPIATARPSENTYITGCFKSVEDIAKILQWDVDPWSIPTEKSLNSIQTPEKLLYLAPLSARPDFGER